MRGQSGSVANWPLQRKTEWLVGRCGRFGGREIPESPVSVSNRDQKLNRTPCPRCSCGLSSPSPSSPCPASRRAASPTAAAPCAGASAPRPSRGSSERPWARSSAAAAEPARRASRALSAAWSQCGGHLRAAVAVGAGVGRCLQFASVCVCVCCMCECAEPHEPGPLACYTCLRAMPPMAARPPPAATHNSRPRAPPPSPRSPKRKHGIAAASASTEVAPGRFWGAQATPPPAVAGVLASALSLRCWSPARWR